MAYFLTTVSHSTTGAKTVTVGFAAKHLKITVTRRGSGDTQNHQSVGDYNKDQLLQVCDYWFGYDGSAGLSDRTTTRIVKFPWRNGGSITYPTEAHVDESTAPWTATEVKYIVDTADVNCQYKVEAWD